MSDLASLSALSLAIVFASAAVLKVVRPSTTEMVELKLPNPRALAVAVPAVELATAGSLVVAPRWGGFAAVALLAAFTGVIVGALRSGRSVSCGCLGSLSRRPLGWSAVVRNGALGLLGLGAAWSPGPTVPDLASVLTMVGFGLVAAVAAQLVATGETLGRLWSVQLVGERRSP